MSKLSSSANRYASLLRRIGGDVEFGAYDPGQWLKLIDLQKRHRATQFEVRKVLQELKNRGLVEHRQNYGFRVGQPDAADSAQITYVRIAVERSAAPLIVERATAHDIADLTALSRAFTKSIRLPGRHRQAFANQAFHDRLFDIAGNAVLAEQIQALRSRYYATAGRWRSVEGLRASSDEHWRIVETIKTRDRAMLERLIVRHVAAFAGESMHEAGRLA